MFDAIKLSMTVYTVLTRISGDTIGKVIFQKVSQPLAPSTLHDSYSEGGIAPSPARNTKIWMPDDDITTNSRSIGPTMNSIRPSLMPMSVR